MKRHRRIRSVTKGNTPLSDGARAAMCEGKYPYPSITSAREVATRYRTRGRGPLEAYRCKACHGFHVGHPRTFTDVKDATYDHGRDRARSRDEIRRIVEGL